MEPRSRADRAPQLFDRALRAEVRDGLWMLSRQWQTWRVSGRRRRRAGACPDAHGPHDTDQGQTRRGSGPPPWTIRCRSRRAWSASSPPVVRGGRKIAFDLRLMLGRHWLKAITGIGDYAQAFRDAYPILPRRMPTSEGGRRHLRPPSQLRHDRAVAGRAMDGGELYLHLIEAGADASDGVAVPTRQGRAQHRRRKARRLVRPADQPASGGPRWRLDAGPLEYQFHCSAPIGERGQSLPPTEYTPAGSTGGRSTSTRREHRSRRPRRASRAGRGRTVSGSEMRTVIPTPFSYDGMPNRAGGHSRTAR